MIDDKAKFQAADEKAKAMQNVALSHSQASTPASPMCVCVYVY